MNFSLREKIMIGVAALIFLVMIGYFIVPFIQKRVHKLNLRLMDTEENYIEILSLKNEYLMLKKRIEEAKKRSGKRISILKVLEEIALETDIPKESIARINPTSKPISDVLEESLADVKLENITLKKLSEYLQTIEDFKDTTIKTDKLQIKTRFDNPQMLDVVFRVSAMVPK